jgi:SAM-dependent methyltransferase
MTSSSSRARDSTTPHRAITGADHINSASLLAESRVRRTTSMQRHITPPRHRSGIEIGAAATPAVVLWGTRVAYVDKYPIEVLKADPELADLPVAAPDILASAEQLETIEDDSQDFVLAFSLLEHSQDPLGSMYNFHRVTVNGGIIIASVPDKRHYEPDRQRPLTSFEHLVRDHREGPVVSCADHFREVGAVRWGLEGEELDAFVANGVDNDAHTHFHVWDPETFLDFVLRARLELRVDYEVLEFASYGHECHVVLRVVK